MIRIVKSIPLPYCQEMELTLIDILKYLDVNGRVRYEQDHYEIEIVNATNSRLLKNYESVPFSYIDSWDIEDMLVELMELIGFKKTWDLSYLHYGYGYDYAHLYHFTKEGKEVNLVVATLDPEYTGNPDHLEFVIILERC